MEIYTPLPCTRDTPLPQFLRGQHPFYHLSPPHTLMCTLLLRQKPSGSQFVSGSRKRTAQSYTEVSPPMELEMAGALTV